VKRSPIRPWLELFGEWFVAGLAGAIAEQIVERTAKAIRKRRKKKEKDDATV